MGNIQERTLQVRRRRQKKGQVWEMTEDRRLELEEKLNIAEASGDPKQVEAVKKTMDQEYRLCTSHTADRLKRVEKTVIEIKEGLIPHDMFENMQSDIKGLRGIVTELKTEVESWKNKAKGAKLLWKILAWIVSAGGAGYVLKALSASGKINF